MTPKWAPGLLQDLNLSELSVQPESLTRIFLREYPFEIAFASADTLKRHFPTVRALIANLIWQALYYHQMGVKKGYGKAHHAFWYKPLHATLERADLIDHRLTKEATETLFQIILARMVDEDRLFDFRQLGFSDEHVRQREIGAKYPQVILLIEKNTVAEGGIEVARHFGISWVVSGGVSRLVAVEFFCAALRRIYQGPVIVLVLGDFDPGGWLNGRIFLEHLARYGTPLTSGPHYLVRPELYTQEELDLFSRPLSSKDGRVEEWLAESGGINGQPRGIHADWLQPPERLHPSIEAILSQNV